MTVRDCAPYRAAKGFGHSDGRRPNASKQIAIRFDGDTMAKIAALAEGSGWSFAKQVRFLINAALATQDHDNAE